MERFSIIIIQCFLEITFAQNNISFQRSLINDEREADLILIAVYNIF